MVVARTAAAGEVPTAVVGPAAVEAAGDRAAAPTVPEADRREGDPTVVPEAVALTWVVRRRVLPGVVPTGRAGAVVPLPTAGVAVRVVLTWGALTWVGPTWVVRRRVLPGVAPTGRAEAEPEPPRWVRQAGPTAVLEMVHPGAGRAVVAETEIRQADRLHYPNRSTVRNAVRSPARAAAAAAPRRDATAQEWTAPARIRPPAENPGPVEKNLQPEGPAAHRIADTAVHPVPVGYRMPRNCCCPFARLQAEVSTCWYGVWRSSAAPKTVVVNGAIPLQRRRWSSPDAVRSPRAVPPPPVAPGRRRDRLFTSTPTTVGDAKRRWKRHRAAEYRGPTPA